LRAWIDRILVPGKTFGYSADGQRQGLAGGKRVIVALARGGRYDDPAFAVGEHAETYLRWVFNFIGIEPEFIRADGVSAGQREEALSGALRHAAELKAA